MDNNIINTLLDHERVTSTYADIYFDDSYCKSNVTSSDQNITQESKGVDDDIFDEWISPSDLLIGKIELKPPFTSKITRGKTHEGILAIGNEVLQRDHKRFLSSLTSTLRESDESWNDMLVIEKSLVTKKIQEIFQKIFQQKSKTMNEEIMSFYEKTLQELEKHSQSEVQNVLCNVQANLISTLNIEIPRNLKKERIKLENVLKKKYKTEIDKIIMYYKLLLNNEITKHNTLICYALNERNGILQAFCKQIDAERLTASMYIMSIERKKCKIRQLFLEKLQQSELTEKLTKIKERHKTIDAFKEKERRVSDINKEWEDKMKKILELFLKFISFSLKLLPEQSNFLLDFQKMVVLQINEMQKQPNLHPNILLDERNLLNIFEFEKPCVEKKECNNEPFFLVGDLSDPIPPRYGSTETLPSNVDLPFIRVNRQYVYAKCHGYEDIKKFLNSQKCQCAQQPSSTAAASTTSLKTCYSSPVAQPPSTNTSVLSTSSLETLLFEDIIRQDECPARKCEYWAQRNLFPFLPSYLDFNEENFERVKAILGKPVSKLRLPELINAKNIACDEIPFAETKEKYRHVATQYSVQEIEIPDIDCTCVNEHKIDKIKSVETVKETASQIIADALNKRKESIKQMLHQNPNLLKIFTDENFDFQL